MSDQSITEATTLLDVLPLVIQHSSICSRLGSLCSLLCTSQQADHIVQQTCSGKLRLNESGPAQMVWFARYCPLVSSLRLTAGFGDTDNARRQAIEEGLAAAVERSATAVAGLSQLQSVKAFAVTQRMLSCLQPFTALTFLSLQGLRGYGEAVTARAALAGFTSLRCLVLKTASDQLLPGTSSLSNLTSLTVNDMPDSGVEHLKHLPPQLQELIVTLSHHSDVEQVCTDLRHVTGLTRMVATPSKEEAGLVINQGVLLPANFMHLAVDDVESVRPLLELLHLQRLELHSCWLAPTGYSYGFHDDDDDIDPEQHVLQLSSLTQLSDLHVTVNSIDMAGDAWLRLPSLRGLQVGLLGSKNRSIGTASLCIMSQLTALQRLALINLSLEYSSINKLADVFRGLTGLQSIGLGNCVVGEDVSSSPFAGAMGVIAGLLELRELRLVGLNQWDSAASAALAAATQLTDLMISGNGFGSLVGQVHKLYGLRRLWMNTVDVHLFDVEAAASSLTNLTELCMPDVGRLIGIFPGVALGHVPFNAWGDGDVFDRVAWKPQWWSFDTEDLESDDSLL